MNSNIYVSPGRFIFNHIQMVTSVSLMKGFDRFLHHFPIFRPSFDINMIHVLVIEGAKNDFFLMLLTWQAQYAGTKN